jgi:hypothetical protein
VPAPMLSGLACQRRGKRALISVAALGTSETYRDVCSGGGYRGMSGLLVDIVNPSRLTRLYGPAVRRKKFHRSGLRSCINVSGLWLERCVAPGHHGYQRAVDLISGQASKAKRVTSVRSRREDRPPSRRYLSQTSAGKLGSLRLHRAAPQSSSTFLWFD